MVTLYVKHRALSDSEPSLSRVWKMNTNLAMDLLKHCGVLKPETAVAASCALIATPTMYEPRDALVRTGDAVRDLRCRSPLPARRARVKR